jgi:succinate dehydrogenase / fumarate reductase cytochrome b subunit
MTDTSIQKERPLSPHLQVYKPQITSISSILHRMAGVFLTFGLFLITWGLIALADGRESFECFVEFCASTFGQIVLVGWSAAFYYHMSTGLRHFILDSGFLFEKKAASVSGFVVIAIAAILTALTWGYIYKDMLIGGAV